MKLKNPKSVTDLRVTLAWACTTLLFQHNKNKNYCDTKQNHNSSHIC